jgi:hypothetical protein
MSIDFILLALGRIITWFVVPGENYAKLYNTNI